MRAGKLSRSLALLATALAAGLLATVLVALTGPGGHPPPGPAAAPAPAGVKIASVQLLALRAADPQGGPPWALRIVRTTRGWICAQVGRVDRGRFGELGLDGAFSDDRRLHPPPASQIPEEVAPGTGPVNDDCMAPGETFAGEIAAIDRSAAFGIAERRVPSADLRRVSFGLLGHHALSITYTEHGRPVTRLLLRPYGAYLLVEGVSGRAGVPGIGAAPGNDDPSRLQAAGLTSALTSIRYRYDGSYCVERKNGPSCTANLPTPPRSVPDVRGRTPERSRRRSP
ncbi:MAG: hypothetical protein ACLPUT_00215 [Solirubrobacteraceae bacterium]